MFIKEKEKQLLIKLFCNTKLSIFEIYDLLNLKDEITVEELYDFLYNYEDENGNKLKRNNKIEDEDYQQIVQQLKNKRNYIIKQNRKKQDKPDTRIRYVKISLKKLDEFDEQGYSLEQIEKHFKKYGIDIYQEGILESDKTTQEYKKINNNLNQIVFDMKYKGLSYRDISDELEANGIIMSYETVRRMYKKMHKDKNEVQDTNKYKNITINKNDLQKMVFEIAKKKKANKEQLKKFAEKVSNIYNTEIKIDIDKDKEDMEK